MSKRYIFPQQYGERKKPKLDVSISDHNFPLSQNPGPNKESNQTDNWGDDNDDEILLLASQACEDVFNVHDISQVPNYSMCMQPGSTSTQIANEPGPSSSKSSFSFKKPATSLPNYTSTNIKDKCNRISSPLPGITPKVASSMNGHSNVSDDLIFNDQVYKGQDSEHIYRQMLKLQEENAKLKSENGKLLEKCVTKEGEASILRTQLKSSQMAVDSARLDKLKAQEKVQMEWTEKLTAANKQMQDLRTQLDFKNLEIISTKEKCKMLENSKVKLTQVTVAGNDVSFSHRNNNSIHINEPMMMTQSRRMKLAHSGAQTDGKTYFVKLNKTCRSAHSKLKDILPLVLHQSNEKQNSILEYSEKLQKPVDFSQNKCRIFSTFHRIPSSPVTKEKRREKFSISCLYEDLTFIATNSDACLDGLHEKYDNIYKSVCVVLNDVLSELELVSQRVTTAFQKEMDEKYIEATSTHLEVDKKDLLCCNSLYKDEQAITARRVTAILASIIEYTANVQLVSKFIEENSKSTSETEANRNILENICRICTLLDNTCTTVLYSGLLLAMIYTLENIWEKSDKSTLHTKLLNIVKTIITSRPLPIVSTKMLGFMRKLAILKPFVNNLCSGSTVGNLKTDFDQGVLLYKKDSCYLQIYLKQIEAALKCMERHNMRAAAVETTRDLVAFYSCVSSELSGRDKSRCDCQLVTSQVIVFALQICAAMLHSHRSTEDNIHKDLQTICRSGVLILYQWVLRDVEFTSQLGFNEGHYHLFVELCEEMKDQLVLNEIQGNMLSELVGTLQTSAEDLDMPSATHQNVWINSFKSFTLAD
ncbi:uncharacterized protein LOC105381383 [Plutella xylostella]|uniref:uncharacterized protein LOC105381383 n=1 Tax=Plutella xylostella TaxID=51655 RepID=UPI00203284C6|nr:uncharacterized protein LOC105381383 [Plutella xylostella]